MTFSSMKTTVSDWLARADLSAVVGDFINFALRDIERTNSFRYMKVRKQVSVVPGTYNYADPFTGYKELDSAMLIDSSGNITQLEKQDPASAVVEAPNLTQNTGTPLTISRRPKTTSGDEFILRPTPNAAYTLDLSAFCYSPDLVTTSNENNWLTDNASDVLILGACLQAAPYMGSDQRLQIWAMTFKSALSKLDAIDADEKFDGSPQCIKTVGWPLKRSPNFYNI